jgi:hypothetical protein
VSDVLKGAGKTQWPVVMPNRGASNSEKRALSVSASQFNLDIECKPLGGGLIEGILQVLALDAAQGFHERPGRAGGAANKECQKFQRCLWQRHRPYRGVVFPVPNTAHELDEIQLTALDAVVAFIGCHSNSCSAQAHWHRKPYSIASLQLATTECPWDG